jgi:hypothetical protein
MVSAFLLPRMTAATAGEIAGGGEGWLTGVRPGDLAAPRLAELFPRSLTRLVPLRVEGPLELAGREVDIR